MDGSSYSLPLRHLSGTRIDREDPTADSRASTRQQKNVQDPVRSPRQHPAVNGITGSTVVAQPRGKAVKDQNTIYNGSAVQRSPSKRLFLNDGSGARPSTGSVANSPTILHSRQTSTNKAPRFSFAALPSFTRPDQATSDTQQSSTPLMVGTQSLSQLHHDPTNPHSFATSGPGRRVFSGSQTFTPGSTAQDQRGMAQNITSRAAEPLVARQSSSFRRQSTTSQSQAQSRAPDVSNIDLAAPVPKMRRKSYFPSTNVNSAGYKPPRKSIGPGTFIPHEDEQWHLAPTHQQEINLTEPVFDDLDSTKSYQEFTPELGKDQQLQKQKISWNTPDYGLPLGLDTNAPVPGKNLAKDSATPPSDRRLSMMPNNAHATGLAARTISPTDARRWRRMSTMPSAPPLPHTPPTPHSDASPAVPVAAIPSPSMLPRKSITPSSSRTTPEPNRKSFSSGISNSSSTSYNSIANQSAQPRLPQGVLSSRLPTLKTRHEAPPPAEDEVVPPVPAIPKAYESPKTEMEQPFFSSASQRKSSLPYEVDSMINPHPPAKYDHSTFDQQVPNFDREAHRQHGHASEYHAATERRINGIDNINRRTLQQVQLPPLKLLPLSAPTAAKIAALYNGKTAMDLGTTTPQPRPGPTVAPSTPMTASKANFSRKSREDVDMTMLDQERSSSSHHTVRPLSSSHNLMRDPSSQPLPFKDISRRRVDSPFSSFSVPKGSGEIGQSKPHANKDSKSLSTTADRKPKASGPRLQKLPVDHGKEIGSFTSPSTPTSSFGSSLRRKLSLTGRRSSKAQSRSEQRGDDEAMPQRSMHDLMPPPKVPASANWHGFGTSSPTPSLKQSQLSSRRKASNTSLKSGHERSRSNTWNADDSKRSGLGTGQCATPTTKKAIKIALGGPAGLSRPAKDAGDGFALLRMLDRDDQIAEEEMRKLATRRRDTEKAARELDALRRRANAKAGVSPSHALQVAQLNIFEKGEIIDFRDVYFCGTHGAKKHQGDLQAETTNFGYDDERGDYNIVEGDHLAYRYEIVDVLGKGSFGQVARCIDHKTGGLAAIKVIRNKKRFHQQALIEVDILQKLRQWDPHNHHSMVNFTQSFYFRGHLCITTELLGMNLYEFIKIYDFRGFSIKLIRRFAKQLLGSLVLLKQHKVIHCDLKPENILLVHPAQAEIKVIDFGSSCLENEKVYTYIQSRFYRSPEVILGMSYGLPIDMWSVGCILAELLTGYPIFPGENEQEQLACIMEVFGPPEKHLIEKSTRKKLFFDSLGKPRLTVSSKGKRRRPSSKTLAQVLKCEDEAFLDFITRCLRWDPERRLKPDEAILHDFITGKKTVPKPIRSQIGAIQNSPVKRMSSVQASAHSRSLPQPPTSTPKTTGFGAPQTTKSTAYSGSPVKNTAAITPRRHSTFNGLQPNTGAAGVKRTVTGTAVPTMTNLPRASNQRVGSGRSDMAAAAAMASLVGAVPRAIWFVAVCGSADDYPRNLDKTRVKHMKL